MPGVPGGQAAEGAEPKGPEELRPLGTGARRVRAKYTCDPGYTDATDCFCVRFSPDDQYLAASFSNGAVHVFDAATGKQEFVLNAPSEAEQGKLSAPLPTTQLRWRPHSAQSKTKSVLISVNAEFDGQVLHWHIKSGKCLHTITERGNQLFCIDYFNDGSQFATAGRDRIVRIYDEATKRMTQELSSGDLKESAGHSNRVFSLKYHPTDPNILISGGWDNTVQMWDVRRGHSIKSLWNCYICGDSVDFSNDGARILTGSYRPEDALQTWDVGTGKVIETVDWRASTGQTSMLFGAQFSKDPESSMIIAGGSQDNEAKFFDCSKGQTAAPFGALMNLRKPVYSVDFSPNSKMAAIGCADGQVRVLEVM